MRQKIIVTVSFLGLYLVVMPMLLNVFVRLNLREDQVLFLTTGLVLYSILVVSKWQNVKLFEAPSHRVVDYLKAIGLGFLLTIVGRLLLMPFLPETVMRNQNAIERMIHGSNIVFMIAVLVILGPILEEIIYRWLFMKILFPKHPIIAILLSSTLFALAHYGTTVTEFVVYFLPGVYLGVIAYLFKGLSYSVAFHITMNAVAFIVTLYL